MTTTDQPTPDAVNGSGPKLSPSQKAYMEAAQKLAVASSAMVARELGQDVPPDLAKLLTYLLGAMRQREADVYAVLDILVENKLATRDQFHDKAAAHAEKYAAQLFAQFKTPAIFVPPGRG